MKLHQKYQKTFFKKCFSGNVRVSSDISGVAAIEFSILAPIVIFMLLAVVDISTLIKDKFVLSDYTRSMSSIIHATKGSASDIAYHESVLSTTLFAQNKSQPTLTLNQVCFCGGSQVFCNEGTQCSSGDVFEEYIDFSVSYTSSPPFLLAPMTLNNSGMVRLAR